ncbi:DUF2946 domain-containing protein [Paraburkholderia metrosideri]|uniref:DUF2946 domain-containing protein n=1 Tax=Paraburkholderia metrosideri TaxID=580937 RepID=A0ABW9E637_9BURK
MLSRFHRKIGSWLGLFAILTATLAPAISHSLAARNGGETGMEAGHCSMPSMASMSESDATSSMSSTSSMPSMQDQASDDTGSKHTQHSATSDGDACGYCSLLAHMPVVPSVEALFSVTVRALRHTVATRFASVRRVEPLTFAQPRAPPFAS